MSHTKTPWTIHPKARLVVESELGIVASCGNANNLEKDWADNAAFIVEACNSYENLKSENKLMREALYKIVTEGHCHECESVNIALFSLSPKSALSGEGEGK